MSERVYERLPYVGYFGFLIWLVVVELTLLK